MAVKIFMSPLFIFRLVRKKEQVGKLMENFDCFEITWLWLKEQDKLIGFILKNNSLTQQLQARSNRSIH